MIRIEMELIVRAHFGLIRNVTQFLLGRFSALVRTGGLVALIVLLYGLAPSYAEWTLLDGARTHPDYRGPVPKKSDVIFSTRFKRPEALDIIKAYGATRVEWVYSTDPQFVQSLRSVVPWFGGAVNSTIPLADDGGIARDLDGRPIVAPWMKSWGARWVTTTDPRTRSALESLAKQYLELGAGSIQVDDPLLQYGAAKWGGDFSESSLAGFRGYLLAYPDRAVLQKAGIVASSNFDYKMFLAGTYGITTTKEYLDRYRSLPASTLWLDYLKESVIAYLTGFRNFLNSAKGAVVPLSMNLRILGPDETAPEFNLTPFVDYAMVETRIDDPDLLSLQVATYRALGIGHVPSLLPLGKEENRNAIAILYASGAQPLVPWDVYINNGPDREPSRFFGAPRDYADLYRFVAKNAPYFDGYEELAVVGILAPVDRYRPKQTLSLAQRLSKAGVPYGIVPIGGSKQKYPLDPERASHYRLLLTVNPASDFSADELAAIRALPVKLSSVQDETDESLESLSPYWSTGHNKVSLIGRGKKGGTNTIILHVIRANEQGENAVRTDCEITIGIRRQALPVSSVKIVSWHSLRNDMEIPFTENARGVSVRIPDCEQWGFLVISR